MIRFPVFVILSALILTPELSLVTCHLRSGFNDTSLQSHNNVPILWKLMRIRRHPNQPLSILPDMLRNATEEPEIRSVDELVANTENYVIPNNSYIRHKRNTRNKAKFSLPREMKLVSLADENFKEQISSIGHTDSWKFITDADVLKLKNHDDLWQNFEHDGDVASEVRSPRNIADADISLVKSNTSDSNELVNAPDVVAMNVTQIWPNPESNRSDGGIFDLDNGRLSDFSNSTNDTSTPEKNVENIPAVELVQQGLHFNHSNGGNSHSVENDYYAGDEKNISVSEDTNDITTTENELVIKSVENSVSTSNYEKIDLLEINQNESSLPQSSDVKISNISTNPDKQSKSLPNTLFKESLKSNENITIVSIKNNIGQANQTKSENSHLDRTTNSPKRNKAEADFILESCNHEHDTHKAQGDAAAVDISGQYQALDASNLSATLKELNDEFRYDSIKRSLWTDLSLTLEDFAEEMMHVIKDFTKKAIYSTEKILKKAGEKTKELFKKTEDDLKNVPVINRTLDNIDALSHTNMSLVNTTTAKLVDNTMEVAKNVTSKVKLYNFNLYNNFMHKIANQSNTRFPIGSALGKIRSFYLGK